MEEKNENSFLEELLAAGFMNHLQGNISEAERTYKILLDKGYTHPGVFSNYGIICKNKGEIDKAINLYKKSIELYPNSPDAYSNLGNLMREQGNRKEAEFYLRKVIEIEPSFYQAYSNLVEILIDTSNLKEAEYLIHKAIRLNPKFANAHLSLGRLLWMQGKINEAEKSTLEAIKLNPKLGDAYMNIGAIFMDQSRLDEAEEATLKAIDLDPNNPISFYNLGIILKNKGIINEAKKSILKAIELNPNLADSYCSLGSILIDQGNLNEAKKYFIKAIQINSTFAKPFYLLSTIDDLSSQLELYEYLFSQRILLNRNKKELIDIFFARANIKHQEKRYREGAKFLLKANKLKLTVFPSDVKKVINETQKSFAECSSFEKKIITLTNRTDHIFIVGMPRSGSTLIESILSMNPKIFALGEVNFLEESFLEYKRPDRINSSKGLYQLYLEKIRELNPNSSCTTDKMLYNYQYIQLIVDFIPGAKIIHSFRNPLDNILSIYRAHFAKGNTYSSSLIDSVNVYLNQERIIQYHKKNYPSQLYELNYDSLVSNPSIHIPNLISWLGWDWNDSYLYPEQNTRSILTRSNVEARCPINNKSVGIWKNYKNMLEPAIELLNSKMQ